MSYRIVVAFDLETTGLDCERGDEIVEIGAIPIIDGVLREDCAFHALVDPDRPIPSEAQSVHGITPEMLRGKPRLEVVLPEFLRYLGSHEVLGQNTEFDLKFLQSGCRKLELQPPAGKVHCTMLLSRQLHPGERRHKLDDICRRLSIPVGVRHRSLDDVRLTAQAYLAINERLQARASSH